MALRIAHASRRACRPARETSVAIRSSTWDSVHDCPPDVRGGAELRPLERGRIVRGPRGRSISPRPRRSGVSPFISIQSRSPSRRSRARPRTSCVRSRTVSRSRPPGASSHQCSRSSSAFSAIHSFLAHAWARACELARRVRAKAPREPARLRMRQVLARSRSLRKVSACSLYRRASFTIAVVSSAAPA